MNKKKVIISAIAVIVVIGLIYLNIGRIENALNLTKPVLKVTVKTEFNDTLGVMQVTNMTFMQTTVPVYYRGTDSPAEYPDIDIEIRKDTPTARPISNWISFKRVNAIDTYEFIIPFREPYVPQKGDFLLLAVRMNDFRGILEYKSTAFYTWE